MATMMRTRKSALSIGRIALASADTIRFSDLRLAAPLDRPPDLRLTACLTTRVTARLPARSTARSTARLTAPAEPPA